MLDRELALRTEDRRDFLKTCGAFAGASFVSALSAMAAPAASREERVRFGHTDLYVSRLCQGTAFRKLPRADTPETRAVLYRCLDEGINFFDSSEAYGWGGSETLLGKVISGKRDQVVICTKAAPSHPPSNDTNPNKFKLGETLPLTREVLASKCEASLKRLETDFIDLFLAHNPDEVTPPEELAESMDRLVQAGKVRYWGVSNFKAEAVSRFIEIGQTGSGSAIAGTEDYYNLVAKKRRTFMEREMLPVIGKAGLGLLAFSPLDTGRLAPDFSLRPDDPLVRVTTELDRVARQLDATRPQVCIAWVLSKSEVTCSLAGAEKPEHVKENVPGTRLQLPLDAIKSLNAAGDAYTQATESKKSVPKS